MNGDGWVGPNEANFTCLSRLAADKSDPETAFDPALGFVGRVLLIELMMWLPAWWNVQVRVEKPKAVCFSEGYC